MQRAISSLGCPEFSLDEVLALAARHRIEALELRALGGTVELPGYFAAQFGTPEALAEKLRTQPVRILAFDTSWRLAGGTAAERAQVLAFLPWAEALGVRWLRVFDGRAEAGAEDSLAEMAETARRWREKRVMHGGQTDIMVETHDTLFTAEAIQRFRAAAPGTAILWDAHHTWRKGGEDPLVTWRAIRDGVVHVHIKDSIPRPSARHPFTYVLPGDGGFPAGALLAALRADGYAGAVSLEWEKMWHPYLPPLEEALEVAAQRGWW